MSSFTSILNRDLGFEFSRIGDQTFGGYEGSFAI
jgi:hypothetical protein